MKNTYTELSSKLFSNKPFRIVLDNGLTLLAKEDRSAEVISVQVWVKTGSIYEKEYLGTGISHYLEHMLFKGTEKRNYQEIAEDVQKVGGNINAYTTFDRTVYHIDGPSEAFDTSMDVLSDIVLNSKIDYEETRQEQSVILREIDMGEDDPDRKLMKSVFTTCFKKHPYKYPVIGEKDLFKKITRDDIWTYYKERYVPNNMVLVVVGPYTIDEIKESAEKYFGKPEKQRPNPVLIDNEPEQIAPRTIRTKGDFNIVRGNISFKIPGLSHPDSPALSVMANVLGAGQSSFLWQKLREEKNLVHSIGASIWCPGSTGLFGISYLCDKGKRAEVERAILDELPNALKNSYTQEKIDKVVRQAIVGEVNMQKTIASKAGKLGFIEVVVGELDYSEVFIERLKAVNVSQLQHLHQVYLSSSRMTCATVEPEGEDSHSNGVNTQAPQLPDFEEVKLENGIRLLLQPYTGLPKTNICITLLGGPLHEDPKTRGSTGVLATLLTKDTESRSHEEIAEIVESNAGSFSEFVANNTFGLSCEFLSTDIELASDLLREALMHPKLLESQFNLERDAQMASIKEELDEIVDYGMKKLRKRFFGEHPYATDAFGEIETLEALKLDDIKDLKEKLVVGNNIVVGVGGDFDRDHVVTLLSKWLSKIPAGNPLPSPISFAGPKPSTEKEKLDKEQVVAFQAYPCMGITEENFEVSTLLDVIFSGMSSRLFVKVREEQGLAYYVGSGRMVGVNTGMFYFYSGTNTESYERVHEEFDNEIERIKAGNITDSEFERAKTQIKGNFKMGLQTPGSRVSNAVLYETYGLGANFWKTYTQRIDRVTKEQLQDFAKKYFVKESEVKYTVGAL